MKRDTAERIRSLRVRARLPVLLRGSRSEERAEAVEIAPGGIFVATPRLRPLFQLLALRLELPGGKPLEVLGMVARRVEPAEDPLGRMPAGIGIRFYGLRPEGQKTWQEFVRRRAAEALRERAESLAASTGLDPRLLSAALKSDVSAGHQIPEALADEPEKGGDDRRRRSQRRPPSGIEAELLAEALALSEASGALQELLEGTTATPIFVIDGQRGAVEPPPRARAAQPGRVDLERRQAEADTERITLAGPPGSSGGSSRAIQEAVDRADTIEDLAEAAAAAAFAPTLDAQIGEEARALEPGEEEGDDRETTLPPPPVEADGGRPGQPTAGLAAPPSVLGLAPVEPLGHVVYRLELPSMEALEAFASRALEAGGVFVRTTDVRPPSTPAVVCVVHPRSRDEIHIPGTVVEAPAGAAGAAVAFTALSASTMASFRRFIALGVADAPATRDPQREEDLSLLWPGSAPSTGDEAETPRDTAEIDMSDVLPILAGEQQDP